MAPERLKRHTQFVPDGEVPYIQSDVHENLPKRLHKNPKPKDNEARIGFLKDSPWKHYTKKYRNNLASPVIIAIANREPMKQFMVWKLSREVSKKVLDKNRQLRNRNVVQTKEIYSSSRWFYVVTEFMQISLYHLCRCPQYPEEIQLASISSQVRYNYTSIHLSIDF
jgi:hypothetical protein